jgi:uncharacterized membrane protein
MNYLPLTLPFFALLVGVFLVLLILIQIGVLRFAFMRLGISSGAALLLLLGSLIGSLVNIPVWELPPEEVQSGREVVFYGMHYIVPVLVTGPAP